MKKIFNIILYYLIISFNTFVYAIENKDENFLKIGILAPFTGEFKSMGEEILYAVNLALQDINDPSIKVYPKDIGSKNENINQACEDFEKEGIKIVIGPADSKVHEKLNNFENLIFLSLSNIDSNINKNILMMGINLESQLIAIKKFIKKEKKNKTIILFPKNQYAKHIEKKIRLVNFDNTKIFKYDQDPKKLTQQIEKLTNYNKRKINLNSRIKKLEGSEKPKDIRELNILKQKYTLGKINFDSIVIIDFGDSLKSVLTSLAYTDVSAKEVLIVTGNQWFDQTILEETSIKNFFFPSINLKNFEKFNTKFKKIYKYEPNEIIILAYDSVGLIYYIWEKLGIIKSVNNFNFKSQIKGKIGKFTISENKILQKLDIYKLEDGNFIQNKL